MKKNNTIQYIPNIAIIGFIIPVIYLWIYDFLYIIYKICFSLNQFTKPSSK